VIRIRRELDALTPGNTGLAVSRERKHTDEEIGPLLN
jgi:hypothetical protein